MPSSISRCFALGLSVKIGFAFSALAAVIDLPPSEEQSLTSFETPEALARIAFDHAEITPSPDVTHPLAVSFESTEWPKVSFRAPVDSPWNWSGFGGLAVDVTNSNEAPVSMGIRVDDDIKSNGDLHCRSGMITIPSATTQTILLPFSPSPAELGMKGLPAVSSIPNVLTGGTGPLATNHIVVFQVYLHHPTIPTKLSFSRFRLVKTSPFTMDKVVDEFGQYTRATWPGKLASATDFLTRNAIEEADLQAHQTLPDRDAYGGWSLGPQLKATGYFRTEKVKAADGGMKWSLVDPLGRLFIANGWNWSGSSRPTFTTGREAMFSWLPGGDDPLAKYILLNQHAFQGPVKIGSAYDFYGANLERKYGLNPIPVWQEVMTRRMRSWGIDTVTCFGIDPYLANGKTPFAFVIGGHSSHHINSGTGDWGPIVDPFSPDFASDFARDVPQNKENPYLLGYFVGNELSWGNDSHDPKIHYGIAYGALAAAAADSPAKRAFLVQLQQKYSTVEALNLAWGTQFSNWEALEAPYKVGTPNAAMQTDFSAFLTLFSDTYFRIARDEIRKLDPNHLFIGCRFAGKTPEAVASAARYCDVVSFNIYVAALTPERTDIFKTFDKPVIISEFHFGALDRGLFHPGLVLASDQAARAEMYRHYIESAADNSALVGCIWFESVDEPLLGRLWDGENYNDGFLTVTDTPYPEMVSAARQVHTEVYARRWGSFP